MENLGKKMPDGFLPSAPGIEDILENLRKGGEGWAGLMDKPTDAGKHLTSASQHEDILRDFALMYAHPAGRRIVEYILDQTLRRGCSHPDPAVGIEQEAMYARERRGQNSIAVMMLKMIHDGMNLPAPGSVKSGKKTD